MHSGVMNSMRTVAEDVTFGNTHKHVCAVGVLAACEWMRCLQIFQLEFSTSLKKFSGASDPCSTAQAYRMACAHDGVLEDLTLCRSRLFATTKWVACGRCAARNKAFLGVRL